MSESVIPDRAADDSDRGWGEPPATDNDDERRLSDDRPPHHESRER